MSNSARDQDDGETQNGTGERLWTILSSVAAVVAASIAFWQGCRTQESLDLAQKSLDVVLSETRPFFYLHADQADDRFRLRIINEGPIPGRLVAKSFGFWTDGLRRGEPAPEIHTERTIVFPGSDITTVRFDLAESRIQDRLRAGKRLGFGACVLYESVEPTDVRSWVGELWLNASLKGEAIELEIVQSADYPAQDDSRECDLVSGMPADWSWER